MIEILRDCVIVLLGVITACVAGVIVAATAMTIYKKVRELDK